MNYDHLAVFINLAETLNFSRTALQMNLSQSAVSQTISSMEKELNFLLFYRTRKQVRLTASGQNFYQSMKPMLNLYNKSVQKAQRIAQKREVDLTIGYSGTPFEISILPKIIKRFNNAGVIENTNIYLENFDHNALKDHLLNGDCDIILTMPDIVSKMENIKYFDLAKGVFCANFYNSAVACTKKSIELSELGKYRLIFLDSQWCPPSQSNLQKEIKKDNKKLNLVYANNILNFSIMVHADIGVGIWANFVSSPNDKQIVSIPLAYHQYPHYGFAMLDYGVTKTAKKFASWLQKNYGRLS